MKIVWTDRAKARLQKIHAEIAEDAPKAADDLVRRLVRRSLQLPLPALAARFKYDFSWQPIRH